MPWNGSGLAQRVHNWTQDKINNIKILASRFDEENDDFASMITNTLTKDGQNSPIVDLPMGGQKHTGVGDADARDNYLPVGQYQDGFAVWGVDAGTANAIQAPINPTLTGYGTGGLEARILKIGSDNTGPVTVELSGLAAQDLLNPDGTPLAAGALPANSVIQMFYDGSDFKLCGILSAPATASNSPGDIKASVASSDTGWLLCDGDEVSATTQENLFDAMLPTIGNWGRGTSVGDFTVNTVSNQIILTGHGLLVNDVVYFTSTGTLPDPFAADTKYYVITVVDPNTIEVSATKGGGIIDITDTGTGIHTLYDNFNLPDGRGRNLLGADNMGGVSADRVTDTEADNPGQGAGAEGNAIPNHLHSGSAAHPSHTHGVSLNTGGPSATESTQTGGGDTMATATHTHSVSGNTGNPSASLTHGDTGNPTTTPNVSAVQPYLTVNYLVKT